MEKDEDITVGGRGEGKEERVWHRENEYTKPKNVVLQEFWVSHVFGSFLCLLL